MSAPMKQTTSVAEEFAASGSDHIYSLSWAESCKLYWDSFLTPTVKYEQKLLSHVPVIRSDGTDNRVSEIIDTPVGVTSGVVHDKEMYIHEVCITNTNGGDEEPIDIVLVHGYGAALGFFYKNIDGLSSLPNSRLHVIDLLGFGCSGRPRFPLEKCTNSENSMMRRVLDAESFFVDSLEEWRKKRNIKKFVVVAHSLGGYLMSCYYLKYGRDIVTKIVLVSPVGVEDSDISLYKRFEEGHDENGEVLEDTDMDSWNADDGCEDDRRPDVDREYEIARHQGVDLTKELTDHIEEETECHSGSDDDDDDIADNSSVISVVTDDENEEHHQHQYHHTHQHHSPSRVEQLMRQIKSRVVPGKALTWLWEHQYTPLDIIRLLGPFSGKMTAVWVRNRFQKVEDPVQLEDICKYTARLFLERGSGEYCLGTILAPGSLARLPLCKRLPQQLDASVPVLLMYGELDWMDKRAGYELCQAINDNRGRSGVKAKFRIVPDAGHHLYVDNGPEFERQVLSFIQAV
jgi:cardiolipin-specific phospholipase